LLPNHFPLQGSGSGIYTLNVASRLLAAGHEVMAIVPDHAPVNEYPFSVQTILFHPAEGGDAELDFDFPCFTTHPRSTTTFYELTDAQISAYVEAWRHHFRRAIAAFQPDIIHAQHVWVASFVAHETGLPYVVTCHGTDLMGFEKGPRYRELARTAAAGASTVIAVSRQVRSRAIETYGLPEEQVSLVWNGFDADVFRILPDAGKAAVLSELGLREGDEPLVVFVGKFTEFKGIDVLLRAAAIYEGALPGIRTILVGDGALREEMEALQRRLRLRGVHFAGHRAQPQVARLFNAADVAVVPSRVEPFGLVAVEALACGTPVVATNEGGLPDFIHDEVGALVPVDDPGRLAEAIMDEIRLDTKRTKGPRANRHAFDSFTWEAQVARMIQLYEQALSPSRG
jgi:glycosyltransferase involved in cell wall biosynthesis